VDKWGVLPCQHHPTVAPHAHITWGMNNRSVDGSSSETSSHPFDMKMNNQMTFIVTFPRKDFAPLSKLGNLDTFSVDRYRLNQPFSIFLLWRNPWNNFQVSVNPCIKIIISTAHGTLAWSVSCRYNNPIVIVNALLRREWYFSVDLFILANKFKKLCLFFSITISRGNLGFRGTPVEKPWSKHFT
jgi:hypothetical protein